jgi:hypothetical protein
MHSPADPLSAIPDTERRRLKQLAEAEQAYEHRRLYWAKRLAVVFAILIALYLGAIFLGFPGLR